MNVEQLDIEIRHLDCSTTTTRLQNGFNKAGVVFFFFFCNPHTTSPQEDPHLPNGVSSYYLQAGCMEAPLLFWSRESSTGVGKWSTMKDSLTLWPSIPSSGERKNNFLTMSPPPLVEVHSKYTMWLEDGTHTRTLVVLLRRGGRNLVVHFTYCTFVDNILFFNQVLYDFNTSLAC